VAKLVEGVDKRHPGGSLPWYRQTARLMIDWLTYWLAGCRTDGWTPLEVSQHMLASQFVFEDAVLLSCHSGGRSCSAACRAFTPWTASWTTTARCPSPSSVCLSRCCSQSCCSSSRRSSGWAGVAASLRRMGSNVRVPHAIQCRSPTSQAGRQMDRQAIKQTGLE
jgi:hypothetical protein